MEKLIKSSFSKTMIPIFDKGKVKSVHINPTLIPELLFTFEYKKGNAKNIFLVLTF